MGRKKRNGYGSQGYYADRKENKENAKAEKTELKIRLADAKSRKRKYLCLLLALGIAIYFIVSSGSGLSVLNTLKQFLPTGD